MQGPENYATDIGGSLEKKKQIRRGNFRWAFDVSLAKKLNEFLCSPWKQPHPPTTHSSHRPSLNGKRCNDNTKVCCSAKIEINFRQ